VRIALLDAGARVRIEDVIPTDVPHFVGMALSGGFLDSQVIRFNRNLNCIIGGRGTGKSTALESLRAGSGNQARDTLLESEAGPDSINLVYQDQAGRVHHLSKTKFYEGVNLTDPEEGITRIPIESYGQGETAETIQHCDKDPAVLLAFLDRFIDLDQLKREDGELTDALLGNQTEIERLKLELNARGDIQKAKASADGQLKTLKAKEASKVVDLEEKLARGRQFKAELIKKLSDLFKLHREALNDSSVTDLLSGLEESQLVVGHEEYERVKTLMDQYATKIRHASENVFETSQQTIDAIKKELQHWTVKENEAQTNIDHTRKELETQGIPLDVAYIRKVVKDVADFASRLTDLSFKDAKLKKALEIRRKLVQRRNSVKSQMYVSRRAFGDQINQNLRSTVVDYFITVRFAEGRFSTEFAEIIQREMNWRTSQVPRATLIAQNLSPFQMLDLVLKKDSNPLLDIKDEQGRMVFTVPEANGVVEMLGRDRARWALERCIFEDRPTITVTREFEGLGGRKMHKTLEFAKLSLGQQQAVLLSILLFSKSNEPLVIDQPEDNLDSEFIYKTFVRSLRRVKESRQVIIVTHNANIAVLGDAELIIPLRASSEKAMIRDRGSIDNEDTKELACTILEGSREAFSKRMKMYGY
jgi:energy-coupling factor transporter ATP-binding protein EcfA2